MTSVILLPFLQALNTALPLLLPKTNEDVKMSIVVDSLPLLSTSQKLDMLQESEEEVNLISAKQSLTLSSLQIPVLVDGLMQRLGYNERRQVVKSILDREENSGYPGGRVEPKSAAGTSGRVIPEIRLDSAGEQEEQEEIWAWEEGEEMEYEFCEQEEGAVSN